MTISQALVPLILLWTWGCRELVPSQFTRKGFPGDTAWGWFLTCPWQSRSGQC